MYYPLTDTFIYDKSTFYNKLSDYKKTKDQKILNSLILSVAPFALQLARKYTTDITLIEDFFQEAMIGAMKAIKAFNVNYNCSFLTYASFKMMREIQYYIQNSGIIRIPAYMYSHINNKSKKTSRDHKYLYESYARLAMNPASLDSPLSENTSDNDDCEHSLYDFIGSSENIEEDYIKKESSAQIINHLKKILTPKEFSAVYSYHFDNKKIRQVAKEESCSVQAISFRLSNSARKMRNSHKLKEIYYN